ncbi:hypothetical protein Ahy_B07g088118 [Arachis hypogaea]|uniref:Uncharacterized protein n=1 Tax=Arachis hypogaea TaxID=3818 RepID=A0A444YDR0_ARAHY|nr:hypothetical protein Ahy_B07g088118 [Arachis hypogaea]
MKGQNSPEEVAGAVGLNCPAFSLLQCRCYCWKVIGNNAYKVNWIIANENEIDKRIVCVTSGGTTAPLEQWCVRYVDNFSSGTICCDLLVPEILDDPLLDCFEATEGLTIQDAKPMKDIGPLSTIDYYDLITIRKRGREKEDKKKN